MASAFDAAEPRLFEAGEVSLEERVLGLLEGIERDGHAGCPVCGGRLERGGCQGCGSELI
jgi:hypothetical protein